MAEMSGFQVVLNATGTIAMPRACCRCGEPGTAERKTSAQVTGFGSRKTRSVTVPYCASCAARAKGIDRARLRLTWVVIVFSALCIGFGALVPFLPIAALVVVPTALAIAFAQVMRQRAGSSVEFPNAAWMAAANAKTSTFFVANEKWAKDLAAGNSTTATPWKRKDVMALWVIALLLTGIGSGVIANAARPSIYVDNEGPRPLQIWVDGKKSIVAQPMKPNFAKRATMELPYGMHRFGWSEVGAASPTAQTDPQKVEFAGNHLYNPASNGCYFLDLDVYGSANGKGIVDGPVPLAEFYTFKHVDNWFSENEKSISTKSSGGTRLALHAFQQCDQFRERRCSTPVIKTVMDCLHNAWDAGDKETYQTCFTTAARTCGGQ